MNNFYFFNIIMQLNQLGNLLNSKYEPFANKLALMVDSRLAAIFNNRAAQYNQVAVVR